MTNLKVKIALVLSVIALAAAFTSIQAVDYNTGVEGYASPQQWIQYENFTSTGTNTTPFNISRINWLTVGITQVNQTNVTMFIDGRLLPPVLRFNATLTHDVRTGVKRISPVEYGSVFNLTFIMAANLTAGNFVTEGSAVTINSTETRAYKGEDGTPVNRTVNILNFTEATYSNVTIYDQITGLLLEVNMTWAGGNTKFMTARARFRVLQYATSVVGVRAGFPPLQWVKYENFNVTGTTDALINLSRTVWLEIEVSTVRETNVTLALTGEYYNNTNRTTMDNLEESRISNNLVNGATNMSLNPYATVYNFTFIIGSNLTLNDLVANGSRYKINSTEIRAYRDHNSNLVNRTVNIVNITSATTSNVTVYDNITGLLLEYNYTGADARISFNTTRARFDPRTEDDPWRFLYYATIIIAIVVIVAFIVIRRRKTGYVEVSPEEVATQG